MERRGTFTLGVLLILVGGFFLAVQFVPDLDVWWQSFADWPFWIIGPGLLFIVSGLISGEYGLIVPGTIISGVGCILYYQNYTGDWESWSYAWALIIGFVGVGVFFMHLLQGNVRKAIDEGVTSVITSLVMFVIFGSFMRYIFGQKPFFGPYWPLLIIVWGVWLLLRPYIKPLKTRPIEDSVEEPVIEVDEPEIDVKD
jgi:hypothetical protein